MSLGFLCIYVIFSHLHQFNYTQVSLFFFFFLHVHESLMEAKNSVIRGDRVDQYRKEQNITTGFSGVSCAQSSSQRMKRKLRERKG